MACVRIKLAYIFKLPCPITSLSTYYGCAIFSPFENSIGFIIQAKVYKLYKYRVQAIFSIKVIFVSYDISRVVFI